MSQKQVLQQQLKQTLSPQQMLVVSMLESPILELEERVKHELEENPALEEGRPIEDNNSSDEMDDSFDEMDEFPSSKQDESLVDDYSPDDDIPDYELNINNGPAFDTNLVMPNYSEEVSFSEYLTEQLGLLPIPEERRVMGEYIIGSLDERGYLTREISQVTDDYNLQYDTRRTETEMFEAMMDVQSLEPAGVAARSLDECLFLQLQRKEMTPAIDNAMRILEECFEEFSQRHYDKVQATLAITEEELKAAIDEIVHLNPRPSNGYNDKSISTGNFVVIPDFFYDSETDSLQLNTQDIPPLRVSQTYKNMLQDYKGNVKNQTPDRKAAVLFTKQKLEKAQAFIDALSQRSNTLLNVMGSILKLQHEFFQVGDESALRPMTMKEVANLAHCDISTVSRVAGSKYVQTNFGVYPLKYFFSEGMVTDSGEEVSTREIKAILKSLIDEEDKTHPLPDDKLCELLRQKGFPIARRTVAKYREQLELPVARLRKTL